MPLTINVIEEGFNNETQEFIYTPIATLVLEHSLISISKWEAKWHIPYLDTTDKTEEQNWHYIRCMSLKGDIPDDILYKISRENYNDILDYINDPMTATTFRKSDGDDKPPSNNFVSSEQIYAKMISYNVPVEFEKWHLNRLLTVLKILDEENKEPKKKSERQLIKDYSRIREQNRAKFHIK